MAAVSEDGASKRNPAAGPPDEGMRARCAQLRSARPAWCVELLPLALLPLPELMVPLPEFVVPAVPLVSEPAPIVEPGLLEEALFDDMVLLPAPAVFVPGFVLL
jgi:hypothetical protein